MTAPKQNNPKPIITSNLTPGPTKIPIVEASRLAATSSGILNLTKSEATAATSSVAPTPTTSSSNGLLLAIEILKQRLLGSNPTPAPTRVPTVTPKPTVKPTAAPTPTPSCGTTSVNTVVSANSSGAALSLYPANGAYKKGSTLSLKVNIDPNSNKIDVVDILLSFDPTKLKVTSIVGQVGTYSQYNFPADNYDNLKGRIELNLADADGIGMFNSKNTLAVINFKVNDSAQNNLEVKFDFDPNNPTKITDSNTLKQNELSDILRSVTNGFYTVLPDSCR